MSEVAATIFILGLHQEKKVNDKVPLFICELRTRLFEQVYAHDKVRSIERGVFSGAYADCVSFLRRIWGDHLTLATAIAFDSLRLS
jgi:hypothetical protein